MCTLIYEEFNFKKDPKLTLDNKVYYDLAELRESESVIYYIPNLFFERGVFRLVTTWDLTRSIENQELEDLNELTGIVENAEFKLVNIYHRDYYLDDNDNIHYLYDYRQFICSDPRVLRFK